MSDNNNFKPNLEGYKPLRPFNLFMKNNFPFIENTFEALDTYGLICQLVKYLNTVIENMQTTEENVTLLSNAFNQLNDYVSNYFDNLDVQEEINNKLDEMTEDGTLQEIITAYLNSQAIFCYNNVAEMKNATNLINGSYAKTLGYYEKSDNGAALYKIRTITNDDVVNEQNIIALQDETLIAELIIVENITPEMFGCKGDGVIDDTENLQDVLDFSVNNKVKVVSRKDKKYKITETIVLDGVIEVDFENAEINGNFADNLLQIKVTNDGGYEQNKEIYWTYGGYLKNLVLNGNSVATMGINIIGQKKFTVENIEIVNCVIGLRVGSATESYINNIHLQKCNTGIKNEGADVIYQNIFGRFCNVGIDATGHYTEVFNSHFWVREDQPEFTNSVYAVTDSGIKLENAQIDSYQTGIKIEGTGSFPVILSGMWQQPNDSTENYYLFNITGSYDANGGGIRIYNFTCAGKQQTPYATFSNLNANQFQGFIDYKTCRFIRIQKFPLTTHTELTNISDKIEVVQNRVDIDGNKYHVSLIGKVLTSFKTTVIAKLPQTRYSSGVPLVAKAFVGVTSNQYVVAVPEQLLAVSVNRQQSITIGEINNQDIPVDKYIHIDFEVIVESNNSLTE